MGPPAYTTDSPASRALVDPDKEAIDCQDDPPAQASSTITSAQDNALPPYQASPVSPTDLMEDKVGCQDKEPIDIVQQQVIILFT